LTDDGIQRVLKFESHFNRAAHLRKVPRWVLAGVLYNESNMTAILGANKDTVGPAQISCRVWRKPLKNALIIDSCKDLLEEHVSIHAAAFILSKIRMDYYSRIPPDNPWAFVLTYYRRGFKWERLDDGYFNRVKCFGDMFKNYWHLRSLSIGNSG
jgi:hypothetical protein